MMDSSDSWVMNSKESAMGFILADDGYDIWMTNTRGNKYSTNHTKLDPDNDWEYWDHATFTEASKYDFPVFIDFILSKTGLDQLTVLAHSQGSQSFFYGLANPELAPYYKSKIKVIVALAPTLYVTQTSIINNMFIDSVDKVKDLRIKYKIFSALYNKPLTNFFAYGCQYEWHLCAWITD